MSQPGQQTVAQDAPEPQPERREAAGDFLLAVHDDLRQQLAAVRQQVEDAVSGRRVRAVSAPDLGAQLARHCVAFCDVLSGHHMHEDDAFGYFEQQFPQLRDAIERLRREHHIVADAVEELRRMLDGLSAGTVTPERVRDDLDRLTRLLEDHFAYEEAQLVPALNAG